MLVIRRRAGESILIAEDIEVEVLALTQSHVKLGIRAPKSVTILRREVKLAAEQNLAAAGLVSLESMSNLLEILRGENVISSKNSPEPR
jgi:carbon storage regulator